MPKAGARKVGAQPPDLREEIFSAHQARMVEAAVIVEAGGVVSGLKRAAAAAREGRLDWESPLRGGDEVAAGAELARLRGAAIDVVRAEDVILGELSKASGVATAARLAKNTAGSSFRVVCGAFKKMPASLKGMLRQAIKDGGLEGRMAPQPFVYLDKNYVRILGGVGPALRAVAHLNRPTVIQLRGEFGPIGQEALEAVAAGAFLLMVDTGRQEDLTEVLESLKQHGLRSSVQVAFAGNLRPEHLDRLKTCDLDAVDIGYGVIDAPCLPMRLDVLSRF